MICSKRRTGCKKSNQVGRMVVEREHRVKSGCGFFDRFFVHLSMESLQTLLKLLDAFGNAPENKIALESVPVVEGEEQVRGYIFITNIPYQASERDIRRFLQHHAKCEVLDWTPFKKNRRFSGMGKVNFCEFRLYDTSISVLISKSLT